MSGWLIDDVLPEFTGSGAVLASLPNRRNWRNPIRALRVDIGTTEEQSMRDVAGHKVETAVEARAGFLDRPVLVVLCVSLALGAVVLGALWLGLT
jgi:hypothetical protein